MQIGVCFLLPLDSIQCAGDTLNLSQQKGLVYFQAHQTNLFCWFAALMQTARVAKNNIERAAAGKCEL
jgi:hypothetical protein